MVGLAHALGVIAGELVSGAVAVACVTGLAFVTAIAAVIVVITLPFLRRDRKVDGQCTTERVRGLSTKP